MRIIENPMLEQDGVPYTVRRTWRQRLFSWPWRPWKPTYTITPRVPYQGVLRIDDTTLVMHPQTLQQMRQIIKDDQEHQVPQRSS